MLQLTIYAIMLASGFAAMALVKVARVIFWCLRNRLGYFFVRHFVYPIFLRRSRINPLIHRTYVLFILLYWGGTAACNFVGSPGAVVIASRAGTLAIVNMVPLFFANRLAFLADILGFSLNTFQLIHRSIGIMAFAQGLLHTVLVTRRIRVDITNGIHQTGIMVSRFLRPGSLLIRSYPGRSFHCIDILSNPLAVVLI